jgi:hypothetical protein
VPATTIYHLGSIHNFYIRCAKKTGGFSSTCRIEETLVVAYLFYMLRSKAPAGGAAATDPEGCARMLVGTHPHLLVVRTGNPIALTSLAHLGARRGKAGSYDSRNQQQSRSLVRRAFKK